MQDDDEDDEFPADFEEAVTNLSPEELRETMQESMLEMHAAALLGQGTPLRFPDEVRERVQAYQEENAIIVDELIPRAVAAQVDRVDEVLNTVHRLRKDPGSFEWPIEDPLLCVSIAFMRECMEWWLNKLNEDEEDRRRRPGRRRVDPRFAKDFERNAMRKLSVKETQCVRFGQCRDSGRLPNVA